MESAFSQFLMQFVVQLPVVLVYLTGFILLAIFWRRAPMACALALIALVIGLVTMIGQNVLTTYVIHSRQDMDWGHDRIGHTLTIIAFGSNLLRGIALGLLIAAVLVGRKPGPNS
jgi:hypothetical protein